MLATFIAALAVFAGPAQAEPPVAKIEVPKVVTQQAFTEYARAVYQRKTIHKRAIRRLVHMRVFAATPQAAANERKYQDVLSARRQRRLAATKVVVAHTATALPYVGPDGRRWAIPWSIVSCESKGEWSAYNASGARGVYQLLGHGEPWPANTPAAQAEHHRIAAELWDGGRGAHHWAQCL